MIEKKFTKVLMKKFLIWVIRLVGIIGLIWLILFIKDIPRYRFGYFVEGPELKYEHRGADVLKLENGNVLILGQNSHFCPTQDSCKDNIMPVVEVPSEIYNTKANKIEELRLPNNIRYQAKGILLKNNRLLLTHAYDPSDNRYPKTKKVGELTKDIKPPYLYDSMAIVNLDTLKVEGIIKKQINKIKGYDPNWYFGENFTFLSNSNVLMIDFDNAAIEVFDIQKENSKLVNIEIPTSIYSTVIAKDKNKVLIFGENNLKNKTKQNAQPGNMDNVYEYDIVTEKLKPAGKVLRRDNTTAIKINNNEILIVGSAEVNTAKEIEIYNIQNKSSKIIGELKETRVSFRAETDKLSINKINNNIFLVAGGHRPNYTFDIFLKTAEIIDLNTNIISGGPNLKYIPVAIQSARLNNGNILLLQNDRSNKTTQIFKTR